MKDRYTRKNINEIRRLMDIGNQRHIGNTIGWMVLLFAAAVGSWCNEPKLVW